MRFVPDLPPPITVGKEGLEVKALTQVKAARPVQARTLPPLVLQQPTLLEEASDPVELEENRHDSHFHGERRMYCRRIEQLPILVELRSGIDRRRHKRRDVDETEHIDVKV